MRQQRRGLMGETLEILIVGHDTGFEVQKREYPSAGSR